MAVYVDALIAWPQKATGMGSRYFGGGKQSCHLTADTLDELHDFAARLGLKRAWFQQKGNSLFSHYDLTPNKRQQALNLGAVEGSAYRGRRQLEEANEHGTD